MSNSYLPQYLQSKLDEAERDLVWAREATQAANKQKADLDAEIREYFSDSRKDSVASIAQIVTTR